MDVQHQHHLQRSPDSVIDLLAQRKLKIIIADDSADNVTDLLGTITAQ